VELLIKSIQITEIAFSIYFFTEEFYCIQLFTSTPNDIAELTSSWNHPQKYTTVSP
jgi:hypothetical protein